MNLFVDLPPQLCVLFIRVRVCGVLLGCCSPAGN